VQDAAGRPADLVAEFLIVRDTGFVDFGSNARPEFVAQLPADEFLEFSRNRHAATAEQDACRGETSRFVEHNLPTLARPGKPLQKSQRKTNGEISVAAHPS
jgi:hypothetical protein